MEKANACWEKYARANGNMRKMKGALLSISFFKQWCSMNST